MIRVARGRDEQLPDASMGGFETQRRFVFDPIPAPIADADEDVRDDDRRPYTGRP